MTAKILIATPQAEFGELVRLNVEEGGGYETTLVKTGREVMELANASKYDLVILDAALPDKPFIPLAQNLLDENPNLRLIVLPPNNDPEDASLEEIIYHGILSRPFYPPDLVAMVGELLSGPSHPLNGNGTPAPAETAPEQPDVESPQTEPETGTALPQAEAPVEEKQVLPFEPVNLSAPEPESAVTATGGKEGPIINEEDFAKEVEALFAREAAKSDSYDFAREIEAGQKSQPRLQVEEPGESKPATLTEEETEAFARQLAAQIQVETSKSYMDAGLIEEADNLIETKEDEPVSNEQFARQIFSEVMQETGLNDQALDQSAIDRALRMQKELETPEAIDESSVPVDANVVNEQPVVETTVEPITIPEPLPIQEPEPVILAQEPDSVITPAVPSGPSAAQIEEALQDNSANETYDELSRDDAFLAKKHADMAARYAELASEYQSLAREHADLSQRHSDVAAEKKRLEDEKNDLLARKRELISQIHQTGKSLADIISDTGASSAIILKNGDLVAQFSQMERDSLQEIASTVIRHWDNKTKRDLVRFIRLSTDNNEFSLYASLIREDFILGLIYDPATPISLMRSQSAEITDKLAGEPLIDYIKLPVEDLEKISEEESLPVDVDEEITGLFSESGEDDFINEWVPESGDLNSAANKSSSTPTPDWIAENITNQGSDTLSPLLMDVINQLQKQRDAVQTDSSDIQDDLGVEQTPVAPSPTAWMENADAQSILHDVMSQLQEQEADSQHETPDIIDLEDYEKTFEIKAEPTTDEKVVEESSETILQSVLQQLQQQEEAVIQAEAEDAYELGTLEINDLPMPPVEEEKMADQSPENYPVIELPAPEPILDETVIEESASEPSAFEEPDQEVILLDASLTTHDENSAEDQGKAGEVENSTSSDLPIQTGETEILPAQDETPETTPASNPIEIYSEEVLQDVLSQLEKQEKSVEHQDFPSFDEGDEALADIDEMIEEIIPNFEPQNSATVQEKITESTSADDNDLDQKKDIFHEVLNQLQQADETAEAISLDGNGSSEENVEEVDEPLIFPWEEVDSEQPVVERTSPLLLTPTEEDALSRTQPIKVKAEISPAGSEKLVKNIEEHKTAINNLLSQQTYTCLLIPRRTDTPLSAELSQILSEQLTQIASVFGWNLEKIEIHTDYLLWSIQVLPAVSATNMIRLIRQRTSRRLFTLYPQMLENNTSGDFWAPGFLTVSGSTPPEKIAVENFINQTRRRQQLINTLEA